MTFCGSHVSHFSHDFSSTITTLCSFPSNLHFFCSRLSLLVPVCYREISWYPLFVSLHSACLSATQPSQTKRNLAQKGNDVWVLRDFILVQKNPKILETCERVVCVSIMWNIQERGRVGCSRGKGARWIGHG